MRAMWMMGYSDGGDFNMADSFNGHILRPLLPRPVSSTNNSSNISRFHGADIFSLNHHLGSNIGDQNKLREFNSPPVVVSSRWNPTPEQLRTLEELYQRGTRTPSADQIQHITTQLRRYGKIEGKNVFYWFQNHKARERQKRRRQMESSDPDHHEHNDHHHHHHNDIEIIERKDAGASKATGYQIIEQNKNNRPSSSTNCSSLAEEPVSIQRAAKAAALADCRAAGGSCGWIHLEEEELQQRRSFVERNATWQMMHLSSPSSFMDTTASSSTTKTLSALRTLDPAKQSIKTHHDLNVFMAPSCRENDHGHGFNCLNVLTNEEEEDGCGVSQTLELFPLRGGDDSESNLEKGTDMSAADIDANFTPYQFFEFLPLKN